MSKNILNVFPCLDSKKNKYLVFEKAMRISYFEILGSERSVYECIDFLL